jgi:hypothetical protein
LARAIPYSGPASLLYSPRSYAPCFRLQRLPTRPPICLPSRHGCPSPLDTYARSQDRSPGRTVSVPRGTSRPSIYPTSAPCSVRVPKQTAAVRNGALQFVVSTPITFIFLPYCRTYWASASRRQLLSRNSGRPSPRCTSGHDYKWEGVVLVGSRPSIHPLADS